MILNIIELVYIYYIMLPEKRLNCSIITFSLMLHLGESVYYCVKIQYEIPKIINFSSTQI